MKKRDWLLIGGILLLAAGLFVFLQMYRGRTGASIRITVDGTLYGEYSLTEEQEIEIKTELGYNRIVIDQGQAYMEEADCPDGYCIHQGKISRGNETIVCLPHKLVVEVAGSNVQEDEPDVLAK